MKIQKLLILLSLIALLVGVLPGAAQDEVETTVFVTDDASYAAILIDGWVAQGSREEGLWIASSEETIALLTSDATDVALPSDQYGLLVFAGPIEDVDEWDALAFLSELVISVADPDIETEFTDAYEFEDAGRTYARIDASNNLTDAIALAYEIAPETWAIAILYAAPGERDDTSELGLALVNSVAYSLPLEDTIEGFFGTDYLVPAGWVGGEFEGIVDLANSPEALEAEDLETGQYRIILLAWDGDDLEDTAATLVNGALEDDEFANDPFLLTIGDQEVLQVAVRTGDDLGIGGVLVMEDPDGGPHLVAIYVSAPGESQNIGLTALNMLLNGQVSAETE